MVPARRRSKGHAGGQYNLALMYDLGTGVPQDYAEAARWCRLATDQEHASGQFNLGVMSTARPRACRSPEPTWESWR